LNPWNFGIKFSSNQFHTSVDQCPGLSVAHR
jgi:hypothetical protein